jgi:hypothetical protein
MLGLDSQDLRRDLGELGRSKRAGAAYRVRRGACPGANCGDIRADERRFQRIKHAKELRGAAERGGWEIELRARPGQALCSNAAEQGSLLKLFPERCLETRPLLLVLDHLKPRWPAGEGLIVKRSGQLLHSKCGVENVGGALRAAGSLRECLGEAYRLDHGQ